MTTTVDEAIEVFNEIEYASKLKFTKIINNSNLGRETKAEDVARTVALAKELAEKTNTEFWFTSVDESIYDELSRLLPEESLFKLKLQKKIF